MLKTLSKKLLAKKPMQGQRIAVRRWQTFVNHRRAFYSLIIFMLLFFVSLFAELIINDKPLLIVLDGKIYFPTVASYKETDFGGTFPTNADYSDSFFIEDIKARGAFILPTLHPFSYNTHIRDLGVVAPSPPTLRNPLGTDDQARDVLARLLYGFRISTLFGLVLTISASVIGIFAGLIQGYFGGRTDLIAQRLIEIWGGIPSLYVLILLSSLVHPGFWWLLLLMVLFSWTSLVQLVRAESLRTRKLDFVLAARALGLSDFRIMLRHVLPNALTASITFLPFITAGSMVTLVQLDFLGFGLPAGSPSLGELLLQGKNNLQAPWLGITGFVSIGVILSLLVFVGEGVRQAFDPRYNLEAKN